MFKKYRWNFVFAALLVSVVGFLIVDFILYFSIKNYLFKQTFNEMRLKTNLTMMWLKQMQWDSLTHNPEALHRFAHQISEIANVRVTLIDTTGKVLTDSDVPVEQIPSMDNHLYRPEVQRALQNEWGQEYRRSDTIQRRLFYTALRIQEKDKSIGFLRLAYYAQQFEESMGKILGIIIIANLTGLALLAIITYLLGMIVTFPILKLVRIAKKISAGDLAKNFPVHRKDEIGTLAVVLNQLTERLKSQITKFSSERAKLQNILTNLDIGIIVLDRQKNILQANPELYRILQIQNTPSNQPELMEILYSEVLMNAIELTLEKGIKASGKITCVRNNKKIFLSYIVTPFLITDHQSQGVLIQLHDITELKVLEAIRRDFVANASHELKTPLTAIMGYSETLIDGAIESPIARVKFIRRIREQAQRLEFLIADMLKLSEFERDIPVEVRSVLIAPLIQDVIEDFREKSAQKNINVLMRIPKKMKVKIDEEGIRTVFTNLIDNAIKYTPSNGSITIRTIELDSARIRFEVIDTGIGIDQKYHERIFQRFYRVDKARSRELGGTGLGLAIVKHVIEQHGSKIHVQSTPGNGSCFWFELKKG